MAMQCLYDPLIRSPASHQAEDTHRRRGAGRRSFDLALSRSSSMRLEALSRPTRTAPSTVVAGPPPRRVFRGRLSGERVDLVEREPEEELRDTWQERDRAALSQKHGDDQARLVAKARAEANGAQTALVRKRTARAARSALFDHGGRFGFTGGSSTALSLRTTALGPTGSLSRSPVRLDAHSRVVPTLSDGHRTPKSWNAMPQSGSKNQNQLLIITSK